MNPKKIEIPAPVVKGASSEFYGGDQNWSDKLRYNGCAVILASNIFYTQTNNLSESRKVVDQSEFLTFAEELKDILRPGIFGLPFMTLFAKRFGKFLKNRGMTLRSEPFVQPWTQENIETFICTILEKKGSVAMLHWHCIPKSILSGHWVMVTGIEEKSGEKYFIISTWGMRILFPMEKVLRTKTLHRAMRGFFIKRE